MPGGLKKVQASGQKGQLTFCGFGAVGCAAALAFAGVRAGMLAAALSLAIVLSLAGVLGKVRLVLSQKYARLRGLGRS